MSFRKKPILLLLFFTCLTYRIYAQKGIVVVPIADLLGAPIQSFYHKTSVIKSYENLPESGAPSLCPRIHQLLFNEAVEIIETKNDEVHVRIPQLFYITEASNTKRTEYWTAKKNILPLKDLKKNIIPTHFFPQPINFKANTNNMDNKNIATLITPFYYSKTKQTFSAGTRFVPTGKQTKKKIEVFIFNSNTHAIERGNVQKKQCFIENQQNKSERIATFVHTLKKWAHLPHGFIPYVWGGCSFSSPETNTFTKNQRVTNNTKQSLFTYGSKKKEPKNGLDCAGLVARAAQLHGIPYFFKNTTTLANNLMEITGNETLSNGDLIWIPGHVLIISDVKNNLVIEARGYDHGYGKVHETKIHKIFKNIKNYNDLLHAFKIKKTLLRLDKNDAIVSKIPSFKLLKLSSVWKK